MQEDNSQTSCCSLTKQKTLLIAIGLLVLGAIIVVAILRERIVRYDQNQVTVMGQGKVSYQPDQAEVTLGVQVDKVVKADEALNQLNEKIGKIISAVEALGISKEDIKTQNYSLSPQYEYKDGATNVSGYNATQNFVIKVKGVTENTGLVSQVVSAASIAGANQVVGINYSISDVNSLKQQARVEAIKDAKSKAGALFAAAGLGQPGKVVSWYENYVQTPDNPIPYMDGRGGMGEALSSKPVSSPQVPSGTQEIVVEIGVSYEVE